MDDETKSVIIALQPDDITGIYRGRKGKEREGGVNSDAHLAMDLYQDEPKRKMTILSDQRLSRSISQAVYTDGPVLALSKAEEDTTIQDRQLAYRLSGSRPQTPIPAVVPLVATDGELAGQLARWNAFRPEGGAGDVDDLFSEQEVGEPSSLNNLGRQCRGAGVGDCVACGDTKETCKLMRATCDHSYCIGCINELFEHATKDESLFPPQCCQSFIPLANARPFLDPELTERFERKTVELSTPNRTYCHDATCSGFILPGNIDGDRATCGTCKQVTCAICKAPAHDGDCPEDPALSGLMAIAAEAGYQKCYQYVSAVHSSAISVVSPGRDALVLAGRETVS